MRYGYTPDGKMRYEAAKKMTGFKPVGPDPDPKPTKPKVKKKQPSEKDMAKNLRKINTMKDPYARPKKSDKIGPRPSTMGY